MQADVWKKIESLYLAALSHPPEQRDSFVDRACSGDEFVHREVKSLLAQNDDSFLDHSPVSNGLGIAAGSTLSIGTQLGNFEVMQLLGSGGMGEVWRARDLRLNRDVAIKVLAGRFTERFEGEAHAIAALSHPHICALYDIGPNYLVMEFIEGDTLAARLRKGPLALDEALKIAIDVSGGLSAAHRKGVIHRDLKPANIMLSPTGAKLLDFGLAMFQPVPPTLGDNNAHLPESQILGTLPYMSPEQLRGEEVDLRSDIFALGAVLFEMLTGTSAFQRQSAADTMTAVSTQEPARLRQLGVSVPAELERLIRRCLAKKREERFSSVMQVEHALEACRLSSPSANGLAVLRHQIKRPRVAVALALLLFITAGPLGWWFWRDSRIRWARNEVMPRIGRLVEQDKRGEAYALALEAERYIKDDPLLADTWKQISGVVSIRTKPPGAFVFRRNYGTSRGPWEFVGRTPIETLRVPSVPSVWRLELAGFTPIDLPRFSPAPIDKTLIREVDAPSGMVRVTMPAGELITITGMTNLEDLPGVPIEEFWIDRYEVTNKEFKQFVDAGGYEEQKYWKHEFRREGRTLTWPEAMALFRDATGKPGPATWEGGHYPSARGDFPVSGVSWYEAAAYAAFVGKKLPTIFHWNRAASPLFNMEIIPASNFSGRGPSRAGEYQGMSRCGAFDMAGNVKEWCWNEAESEKRYILGGGWNEPRYTFNDLDARSPFQRYPNFGFRCASYTTTPGTAKASEKITYNSRDFYREKPVSDQVFHVYKGLYAYDKAPLNAVIESTKVTAEWKEERITFDAAYGNERVIAYLFLPLKASAPFQTVLFFPGADAVGIRSSANITQDYDEFLMFIRSGRAVLFPVYKSTFERGDGLAAPHPTPTNSYRDHAIAWSRDLGRSMDYLETRPEIDKEKLAFAGVSWGAAIGPLLASLEPRIKALVLISPGFYPQKALPEADMINFVTRAKAPVLALNGSYDFFFPATTSQEPLFRLLGTPESQKRRVVFDTSHGLPPGEVSTESLAWLDRYLGPVNHRTGNLR